MVHRSRHRGEDPRRLNAQGVNVAAIPFLRRPHEVISVARLGLAGAAPKDFVVVPSDRKYGHAYIAKRPLRDHTGARECVTEYIISQIGRHLPLRVAEGRLVRLAGASSDAPDVRFMSRYFLRYGKEQLRHGVELVADAFNVGVPAINKEVTRQEGERSFYTIDLIDEVLRVAAMNNRNHMQLRAAFARMLAFDALVGASDRHAENWALIQDTAGREAPRFSPVYDTARGLFLHLPDAKLRVGPDERCELVVQHAMRAKPLVGTGLNDSCNHFELVEHLLTAHPERYRGAVCEVLQKLGPERLSRIARHAGHLYFSKARITIIDCLLRYRCLVLRAMIQGAGWEEACRKVQSGRGWMR